jgi:PAS domain-containing protein
LNNDIENKSGLIGKKPFFSGMDLIDDILIDVVNEDGEVIFMNAEQAATLGVEKTSAHGIHVSSIYTSETVRDIELIFTSDFPAGFQKTMELSLIGRGGRKVRTLARCRAMEFAGAPVYRFSKIVLAGFSDELYNLKVSNKVLKQIIDNANEGHWCIEFLEPVDLEASKESVIDQIFENASNWRVTNPAMERLYELPSGESIDAEDVHLYWSRSDANEKFVRQVYESNFHIDAAIAIDRRHDGSQIYVENDVRADIEDRMLFRIWGNCRDVTSEKQNKEK